MKSVIIYKSINNNARIKILLKFILNRRYFIIICRIALLWLKKKTQFSFVICNIMRFCIRKTIHKVKKIPGKYRFNNLYETPKKTKVIVTFRDVFFDLREFLIHKEYKEEFNQKHFSPLKTTVICVLKYFRILLLEYQSN